MIPRQLQYLFPTSVQRRGNQYFAEQRVTIISCGAAGLSAVVRGSEAWGVDITAGLRHVTMLCACPSAADTGFCKHLWATLRAAEDRKLLRDFFRPVGNLAQARIRTAMTNGTSADDRFDSALTEEELIELDVQLAEQEGYERAPTPVRPQPPPPPSRWKVVLETARHRSAHQPHAEPPAVWPADRRLAYIVDMATGPHLNGLTIDLATEKQRGDGSWDPAVPFRLGANVWFATPDPIDRHIAQMLLGASVISPWNSNAVRTGGFFIGPAAFDTTLRTICDTGRCYLRRAPGRPPADPLTWDAGPPWELRLRLTRSSPGAGVVISGRLRRGDDEMSLTEVALLHVGGILIAHGAVAKFHHGGAFALALELAQEGLIVVADEEIPVFIEALSAYPQLPPLDLPPDLGITECAPTGVPRLTIASMASRMYVRPEYGITLSFDYEGASVPASSDVRVLFDRQTGRLIRRDPEAERAARARLAAFNVREEHDWITNSPVLRLPGNRFETALRTLIAEGWRVDADGVSYRAMGEVRATVRSGIDWFDLEAVVRFGDREVPLPRLLEAMKRGDQTVQLDDGSIGLLSGEWLRRLAPLASTGVAAGDATRFRRAQTAVLDVLLAALPEVDTDAAFETARAEMRAFSTIEPAPPPASFVGVLRPYQSEGLGWLHFLRRFQLGGCLADDMGLGKTVQVLALLECRRLERAGPSLVVVPRSLVFNWVQEAARFTPELRVRDHTGVQRRGTAIDPDAVDLVITTYGTLRQDAVALRDIEFDYVVLDEAQTIKNPSTASAKAARLLRGRHRLALSGTPIENRIEELWSLIEFLNPGMLGTSSAFRSFARRTHAVTEPPGDGASAPETDGRAMLSRALRPVILRRTKDQVARDLPARSEQTLTVELEPTQRALYDELLQHYRAALLPHVDRVGIGRSKMRILEALLRLRQAACHPGLVDTKRAGDASAKLDALLPMLAEIAAEGHKTLVFSQFTSFLALLRARLDADGVTYAYLDGMTRDRQTRVERFQTDPECRLFLISLKAGGHGLNLTAADYVFLLDPWWNPAVEAQAIDRAHRIGQTRHVIATRIVARNTIEQKIIELQQSKRDLADAILGADHGLISKIGRDELAALLS